MIKIHANIQRLTLLLLYCSIYSSLRATDTTLGGIEYKQFAVAPTTSSLFVIVLVV